MNLAQLLSLDGTISHRNARFQKEQIGQLDELIALPWPALKWPSELGGNVTGVTIEQLNSAPE